MSPDSRRHRGSHPEDEKLFTPKQVNILRHAVSDLSWLLSRNYPSNSSLTLVGNHYRLAKRQRLALQKTACSDSQRKSREFLRESSDRLDGKNLLIDGFNLLITVETAMSGGVIILCRDGCMRDLSSVHGSYRTVKETENAIKAAGDFLSVKKTRSVKWLLDRPVSNSGRLAHKITDIAIKNNWPWLVELVDNPDYILQFSKDIIVSSDSAVLDKADSWFNLAETLIRMIPNVWIVDLNTDFSFGKW